MFASGVSTTLPNTYDVHTAPMETATPLEAGMYGCDVVHEAAVVQPSILDDDLPEWQEHALCAQTDPEAFFPEKGGSTREAKKICVGCEVRSECLEYALANDERFGIWGGLSERERRKIRKARVA